jgi:hypothetical protein
MEAEYCLDIGHATRRAHNEIYYGRNKWEFFFVMVKTRHLYNEDFHTHIFLFGYLSSGHLYNKQGYKRTMPSNHLKMQVE